MNIKEELSDTHKGWDTDAHLKEFDHWNKMNNFEFLFKYGCFQEQKYLKEAIKLINKPSILDFGCATGTTNKYLKLIFKENQFDYKGIDISETAINQAKKYYGEHQFELVDENSNYLNNKKFDIVYSRDTVLHQKDPYEFIQFLLKASKHALVLRLRTRDKGETFLDYKNSCQLNYDNYWMPYLVLNFDELKDFLLNQKEVISIKANKSYMTLGGQNNRFLPKDLFYKETGTAETALLINISTEKNNKKQNVIVENKLEGQNYLQSNKRKAIFYRLTSLLSNPKNLLFK